MSPGIMQHIEEAGVHSGDSACCLPPHSLPREVLAEIERQTVALARALNVVGLMNVQFAVKDGRRSTIYLIEVNPRASRTVPFVAKATDSAIASHRRAADGGRAAVHLPAAPALRERRLRHRPALCRPDDARRPAMPWFSVKEAVMPFARFPGVDTILGPEMRSTGEVMGWDRSFPRAFLKAQMGAGDDLPTEGPVFISIRTTTRPPRCARRPRS